MAYAVTRLHPALPQALAAGMGRPQVERLRTLDRAAQALWEAWVPDGPESYDGVFVALCRRYDGPHWELGALRQALEVEIAERADRSLQAVRLELTARLHGEEGTWSRWGPIGEGESEAVGDEAREETDEEGDEAPWEGEGEEPAHGVPQDAPGHTATAPARPSTPLGPARRGRDASAGASAPAAPVTRAPAHPDRPEDLKSLRARAWTLATRIAQRHGMGELVVPLARQGLGFLLQDVPDPALIEQLGANEAAQLSMVWWQLAACAEVTVAPLERLLPLLPAGSVLRRALEEGDVGLLFASLATLDPGLTGHCLWRRLDARGWQDLLDLMATYRAVHARTVETGIALWG